jgi:hypothetical protein
MNPITVFLTITCIATRREYYLRDNEGARRHDPDADSHGRQHESRGGLRLSGANVIGHHALKAPPTDAGQCRTERHDCRPIEREV